MLNEGVRKAKYPKEVAIVIKKHEELIKEQNQRIINIVSKQGELLKRFKELDEYFESVGLSQSNIHFKIRFYRALVMLLVLRNLTLSSNYFKKDYFICLEKVNNFLYYHCFLVLFCSKNDNCFC